MLENDSLPPIVATFGTELHAAMKSAELRGRPRRWARATVATIAAAAGATLIVTVVLLAGGGHNVTTNASAATLARTAQAALRAPSLFPKDDQYYYVRTEGTEPTGMSVKTGPPINAVETIITDRWQSATRPGRTTTRIVALRFDSPSDGARWRSEGPKDVQVGSTLTNSLPAIGGYGLGDGAFRGSLTRRQVFALPTSARALYARLIPTRSELRRATRAELKHFIEQWGDGTLRSAFGGLAFDQIMSTFEEGPLPPKLQSAFYAALALVPGIRQVGAVRDLAGRTGVAVALTRHGIRYELIIDPATGVLLGEREWATARGTGFREGSAVENLAYLNEADTNRLTIPHTKTLR
jgi:hypothetical protein